MANASSPYGAGVSQELFPTQPARLVNASPYSSGFQAQQSPTSGNAQQLFSSPATAPVSENAHQFSPPVAPNPIQQSISVSSAKSADELFGGPLPDTTRLAQNGTSDHTKQDAASMFATPLPHVEGVVRTVTEDVTPPTVSTAKELFIPPIEKVVDTQQHAVDAASLFESAPTANSTLFEAEDEMIDIPLSPKNIPPPAMSSLQPAASNAVQAAPISAAASLFGSIGMPPPPFSNKQ
jgi:hypothetical protein